MRAFRLCIAAILSFIVLACASTSTTPTTEARQALAPTGKLRVALFLGTATMVVKDPASGEMRGVGYYLGREMAGRLNVPFEPVIYTTIPAMLADATKGRWDVVFMGVSPDRAAILDFTPPHMQIDYGYLVPADSKIRSLSDVDRSGVRVAVVEKGSPEAFFSRHLKNATLVRASALPPAIELIKSGKADAFAALKANILDTAARQPGWRVLDGRPGGEDQAAGVPKGRDPAALAFTRRFLEDAKASGLVQKTINDTKLRGAVVAS